MSFTDNYVFALGASGGGLFPAKSRVWYSTDALTWRTIDFTNLTGETLPITSMAMTSDVAIAMSSVGNVYKSADLVAWQSIPMSSYLVERSAIWSTEARTGWVLVMTGRNYNSDSTLVPAYAISSDSGATWTSYFWPNRSTSKYDVVNRVRGLLDGYIYALGYTWDVDANTYTPFVYQSSDGVSWVSKNTPPIN